MNCIDISGKGKIINSQELFLRGGKIRENVHMVMDNGQNILSDHNCVSFSLPKMNCSSRPIFAEGAPCREKPIGEKLSLPRGINQGYQMCPSVRRPSTVMRMMLDTVVRNPVDFLTHVANGGLWFGAGVNVTSCQVCCGPNPTGVVCVRPFLSS